MDKASEVTKLASELYGDKMFIVLRAQAERVSRGRTENINELDDAELDKLINGMKRLKSKIR